MKRTSIHLIIASLFVIMLMAGLPGVSLAFQEQPAVWQAAQDVRDGLFQAQLELFAAERATTPDDHYQAAAGLVERASALYEAGLARTLSGSAPDRHVGVQLALDDALTAARNGDGSRLAHARGRVWTHLLGGAYEVTLAATVQGDATLADAWVRVREFRTATRVSIVDNPAAAAISTMDEGQLAPETATIIVGEDLRDSYHFRMREVLGELEDAVDQQYATRAAEWAALTQGYFSILRADYAQKQGDEAAAAFAETLEELNALTLAGDWAGVQQQIEAVDVALEAYRPVELNSADIAQKSQLLYIFTNLIYVEYRDGVRNGRISIDTEYREAVTFRDQADLVAHELQPAIEAVDPEQARRLLDLLADMETVMSSYGDSGLVQGQVDEALAIIEATLGEQTTSGDTGTFAAVDALLDDMLATVGEGDYAQAERLRIQSYALYDFGPELRLLGFSPRLVAEADGLFWHGYQGHEGLAQAVARQASQDEVAQIVEQLRSNLSESQTVLDAGSTSPGAVIFNAAAIVFREGLEAVIILAALLASMVKPAYRSYRRPLVIGSGLAFLATVITWIVTQHVLVSLSAWGERLEAVVSLIAIGVLLLITNWFFHKVYWKDWMARFHQMKGKLLSAEVGQIVGLMFLGFTSVYREGFETVLFLQALVLDAGHSVVFEGIAVGLIGVAVVGFLTFSLQRRLPYMHMLVATGMLIGLVLVTMVGGTVRTMQAVGWLPISPIYAFQPPYWLGLWFGVYPTWQGIAAQVASGVFVLGSYYLAEGQKKRHRHGLMPVQEPDAPPAPVQKKSLVREELSVQTGSPKQIETRS